MAEEQGRQLLDDKIVQYFDTLDALYSCQQELQDQISAGFFNLSKARYSMGVKAVGALQFDEREMTAGATVDVASDGSDENAELFTLVRDGDAKTEETAVDGSTKPRQRVKKSADRDENEDEKFDDMDWINEEIKKMGIGSLDGLPSEPKPKASNQDPLKWFGVLVPQTLKFSQKNFQHAVQLAVEMANLRHKLLAIKANYQELAKDNDIPTD